MCAFAILSRPASYAAGYRVDAWWAPLGGLVGAIQVYAGLTLVNRVGAGPFMGFTVTAALITSIAIDLFGWFHMPVHPANGGRILGGLLMVSGIALIARF